MDISVNLDLYLASFVKMPHKYLLLNLSVPNVIQYIIIIFHSWINVKKRAVGRVHMESILLHHPPEAAAASPVLCVKTAHFHPWSFSQTPSLHPPFGKQQIGLDKTWNCCCDWGVPLVGPGTGFYGSKAARHTADGSCSPLCSAVNRGCFSFNSQTELE